MSTEHQKACASWNLAGRNCVSDNITRGSAVFWLLLRPRNLQGLIRHEQWNTSGLLRFPFLGRLDIFYLWNRPAFSIGESKTNLMCIQPESHGKVMPLQTISSITQKSSTLTLAEGRTVFCKGLLNAEVTGVWEFYCRSFFVKTCWQIYSYSLL